VVFVEVAPRSLVVGFSQRRLARSIWWKTLVDGAAAAAEEQHVLLDVRDANGDTNRQIADVASFIEQGVDAVVLNPNDPRRIAPALEALSDAGIPTVAVNSTIDDHFLNKICCYVAEDQRAVGDSGGYLLGQAIAERFGTTGIVKTVIVGGYPWDIMSDLRANGFIDGYDRWLLDRDGEGVSLDLLPMLYGHWLAADALPLVRDLVRAHPDLRVIISLSDMMHAGIEHALKTEGLFSDVIIAEYDGLMASVEEMVDDPTGPLQVMVTNEPYRQGATAVELAIRAAAGRGPKGTGNIVRVSTSAFRAADAVKYFDAKRTFVDTPQ
jgi:ribose transport system substrate-binding protein